MWLKHENQGLFLCNGFMLNTARHNEELPLFQENILLWKFDRHPSFDNHEELVPIIVLVLDKFTHNFRNLDRLSIQFPDYLRAPVLVDLIKPIHHLEDIFREWI